MPRQSANTIDVAQLCRSAQNSRIALRKFRDNIVHTVRQYAGNHWSEEGADDKVPVNLLAIYVSVVSQSLVANNPRVLFNTFDRSMKPIVSAMQSWTNYEVQRLRLGDVLQGVVIDALFSMGIAKVCLADPAEAANAGWGLKAGEPFVAPVLLDDFVFDIHARSFDECAYVGHRYRVPLDVVKDARYYSKDRRSLEASDNDQYNETGEERLNFLQRSNYGSNESEFEPMVDLWEFYLPRHRVMVTLADQQLIGPTLTGSKEPLRQWGWIGPESGPFHFLCYGKIPGNAMAKAPIMDLVDLHEAANTMYRKVIRTGERTKEVGLAAGQAEDADRINKANDGDTVQCDQPERFKQEVFGGQHLQTILAVATVCKDLFSYVGGNIELLGGRGPQAKTASQDAMLNQSAQAGIAQMQQKTVDFTASVMKGLGWYWWNHPTKVMTSQYSLPGMPSLAVNRHITPEQRRRGRFEDQELRVDPYSLRYQSPAQRLQALMQVMQTIVMPLMPILQAQGISVDLNTLLKKVGEYTDQPDLNEILTIQAPPPADTEGGPDQPKMPQQTERQYTRTNVPGRTEKGNDQQLVASMLGHNMGGDQEQAA